MEAVWKRSEVPAGYRWRLEDLFADQAAWDRQYDEVKRLLGDIGRLEGKLKDAEAIRQCFELEDELSLRTEQLYVYASNRHNENTADPVFQALLDKAKKLAVEANGAMSFITPDILELPEEQLEALLNEPSLIRYRKTLTDMLRQKPHILSKPEEALLARVGNVSQAPGTIFGMLNNADMKFPLVQNEDGAKVELTHGRYIQFLESRDRDVRKGAFEAMYATYGKLRNTLAATLGANVTKNQFYAKARKYGSALEASLYDDKIPVSVYDSLISTIHESLPLLHRYMNLRKKLLNVDELHMYDLFAPLVDEYKMDIAYEEAKQTVLASIRPLGDEYGAIFAQGLDGGWIDVYENEGKRNGAYCSGAYGTHPFVLLNHKDNLSSMFTLSHEMGHALHSYLSDAVQDYRNAQYTIFLAEVASTLNEALLMDDLLRRATDPQQKMYLLCYYADKFRTTVFRQTMFAEFERLIYSKAEQGESLTHEDLCRIYYDLNVQYHGPAMTVDRDIEMEWARIPHFYRSFYVFKYATGFSAATSFAKQILDEGAPAVERYLGFLQSGGSDYSIEILKRAGVDMSSPEPIRQAMSVFEDLLGQMERMTS
ncbi:oligoendopeptidase F [Paenibacillus hodogayensis]|uniref:Oligopeptidase F n=1 Tax=Paenibacillus hodogayensis TaxID=279208 RepID=A0ABV5VXA4_9BACL